MTLIPLDIPAGFYRNGTDLEQAGRWRDGSLVRWRDNSLRPIGGWQERKTSFCTNVVRGMHTWQANNGTSWVAGASYNEIKAMLGSGTVYDITPTDFVAGRESAEIETGYGYGFYGDGFYGTPRQDLGNYSEATTISLDNFGEYLVICSTEDGRLLEWDLNTSNNAAPITNAPTNNLGLIVTEERFIFALGAGGNPRKVAWCDFEDNTIWSPASTNQAGDIELQTSGQIMQAVRTRGQTLIITDTTAHSAVYTGPPFIYQFNRVGTACGAVSRKSAVDTDAGAFWMGQRAFFRFDGNTVQELKCDVHDYVFGDMNVSQQSKIWSFANGQFSEVWWFYCSSGSNEIDRYIAYDYNEGHWLIGEMDRTAGVPRGVFKYPFLAGHNADTDIYEHEVGLNVDSASVFAETGPIYMGNGDQVGRVTDVVPDEKTQGDVNLTFKTRFYPNADETSHGPFTPSNPTSVRFTGRQMRMRVEGAKLADWRVGNMRIDVKAGGKR